MLVSCEDVCNIQHSAGTLSCNNLQILAPSCPHLCFSFLMRLHPFVKMHHCALALSYSLTCSYTVMHM